jgi:ABC-type phosphate transport system substrate-binding protein
MEMVRLTVFALLTIATAGPMCSTVEAQTEGSEAVAIVVHPQVPIDDLPLDQLKSIFLAERQHWQDRSRITLLVRAAIAPERDRILTEIYGMSEDRYRQYWIAKMFRSEVASGPKIVFSTDMLRDLVTVIPGSIGFVPVSAVGPDLKVIRIDGKLPGDEGYPLN